MIPSLCGDLAGADRKQLTCFKVLRLKSERRTVFENHTLDVLRDASGTSATISTLIEGFAREGSQHHVLRHGALPVRRNQRRNARRAQRCDLASFRTCDTRSAFGARWCVGSKIETAEGVSRCTRTSRRPGSERGCIGRRAAEPREAVRRQAAPVGWLGRPGHRPSFDLLLFAEETVNFGLQFLGAVLPPAGRCLSEFDKPLDQQILHLNDPGPFFGR
jgi:hypothetical protein